MKLVYPTVPLLFYFDDRKQESFVSRLVMHQKTVFSECKKQTGGTVNLNIHYRDFSSFLLAIVEMSPT